MGRLDDQVAVVFGGSSGVGRATARVLAGEGARVIVTGRDRDRLDEVREEIGGDAEVAVVDGRDDAAVGALFERLSRVHHVIVTAGETDRGGPFGFELGMDKFRATFEGKFWVQMRVAHAAIPRLERGGSLTLVSGGAAHRALPGMVNVAAVNGAIEAVVPPLARELAPTRVNAVSPGTLNTGYWRGVPQEQLEAIFRRTAEALPAGRVGEASDIADAVLFLCTNRFVTGTVLCVDGGLAHSSI